MIIFQSLEDVFLKLCRLDQPGDLDDVMQEGNVNTDNIQATRTVSALNIFPVVFLNKFMY